MGLQLGIRRAGLDECLAGKADVAYIGTSVETTFIAIGMDHKAVRLGAERAAKRFYYAPGAVPAQRQIDRYGHGASRTLAPLSRALGLAGSLAPLLALARLHLGALGFTLGEVVSLALRLTQNTRLDNRAPEPAQQRFEALTWLNIHLHLVGLLPSHRLTPPSPCRPSTPISSLDS